MKGNTMKSIKMLGVMSLAVVLLFSFVVLAQAQDKKVTEKATKEAAKEVKVEEKKCPHSATANCEKECSKPCCSKEGDKAHAHIKDAKKDGACCPQATEECKAKCEQAKTEKEKK